MDDGTPYRDTAAAYWQAGWSPLPLPVKRKAPPPTGWTGHRADRPSFADVMAWIEGEEGDGNIGLRLDDEIGIDVDAYGDKQGAATLAEAEARWGKLPATWRSTSRDDGVSGIMLYRVPEIRLKWPTGVGPGIELVHRGHRYAVVAPSIHPEGRRYQWIGPEGQRSDYPPDVDELPILPDAWVYGLTGGEIRDYDAPVGPVAVGPEAAAWLLEWGGDDPCPRVDAALRGALGEIASGVRARHDVATSAVMRLVRQASIGHRGVLDALGKLNTAFVEAVISDGSRSKAEAQGEWVRMATGALGLVAGVIGERPADPCTDPLSGLVSQQKASVERAVAAVENDGPAADTAPPSPIAPRLPDSFWDSRGVLAKIRQAAFASLCSPDAMLGVALARASLLTDHRLMLPRRGSLNVIVALAGPSGTGKGEAIKHGSELVPIRWEPCECGEVDASGAPAHEGMHVVSPIGSGEGMVRNYFESVKVRTIDDKGKTRTEQVQRIDRRNVLVQVDEGAAVASMMKRLGQTTAEIICSAWVGEALGFAYASRERNLRLPRGGYRQSMIIGIQPRLAADIFAMADVGVPQRFVWLGLTGEIPDEPVEWPGIIDLEPITAAEIATGVIVHDDIQAELRAGRIERTRTGIVSELDGHRDFSRLKIAALLARLENRTTVEISDWELSAMVIDTSDAVRDWVQAHIADSRVQSVDASARLDARRQLVVEETVGVEKLGRAAGAIVRRLSRDEWTPRAAVRRKLSAPQREAFDEAVEHLLGEHKIEARDELDPKSPNGRSTFYRLA